MSTMPGKRLQELLDNLGLSAADMSMETNIPKSSLSMYLAGKRKMKADRLKSIAAKYNVNEAWLSGYDVPMMQNDNKAFLLSEISKKLDESKATDTLLKLACKAKEEDIEAVNVVLNRLVNDKISGE